MLGLKSHTDGKMELWKQICVSQLHFCKNKETAPKNKMQKPFFLFSVASHVRWMSCTSRGCALFCLLCCECWVGKLVPFSIAGAKKEALCGALPLRTHWCEKGVSRLAKPKPEEMTPDRLHCLQKSLTICQFPRPCGSRSISNYHDMVRDTAFQTRRESWLRTNKCGSNFFCNLNTSKLGWKCACFHQSGNSLRWLLKGFLQQMLAFRILISSHLWKADICCVRASTSCVLSCLRGVWLCHEQGQCHLALRCLSSKRRTSLSSMVQLLTQNEKTRIPWVKLPAAFLDESNDWKSVRR